MSYGGGRSATAPFKVGDASWRAGASTHLGAPRAFGADGSFAGRYRLLRVIAEGGQGVVLEARLCQGERPVVVKLLRGELGDDEARVTAFVSAARTTARVLSPFIVRVVEAGWVSDLGAYLVTEFLEGRTLGQVRRSHGSLADDEVAFLGLQACQGLAEAHAHGVCHGDVRPSNLFLSAGPDGGPLCKLIDFGIASADDADEKNTPADDVVALARVLMALVSSTNTESGSLREALLPFVDAAAAVRGLTTRTLAAVLARWTPSARSDVRLRLASLLDEPDRAACPDEGGPYGSWTEGAACVSSRRRRSPRG